MSFRRLRSYVVVLSLPLVLADAGPRCGGSSPRPEPADTSQPGDAAALVAVGPRAV